MEMRSFLRSEEEWLGTPEKSVWRELAKIGRWWRAKAES